jgi:hypothetical protein
MAKQKPINDRTPLSDPDRFGLSGDEVGDILISGVPIRERVRMREQKEAQQRLQAQSGKRSQKNPQTPKTSKTSKTPTGLKRSATSSKKPKARSNP